MVFFCPKRGEFDDRYEACEAENEAALIPMSSDSSFGQSAAKSASELEQERLLKEQNAQKLKEVEKQQADFGEKK